MAELYPPIEPYEEGLLDVGDGNRVHWEVSGNPDGRPALVVHGGPGSGCLPGMRRYFDPAAYRIVLFDQRGCGRSTPHAADPAAGMGANTTDHLLADMERLREHLGVRRWVLHGGSWGSTLLLAYAQRHPERVSGIVVNGVTTTRRSEIDWLYRGVGRFFPEQWHRFRAGCRRPRSPVTWSPRTRAGWRARSGRCASGPRPTGAAGRTPSCHWSRTGRPTSTAGGPTTPGSRSSASPRTTSPTAPGWRRARCCATPGG
ncbi:alpha/beta fold hydrolase [Streptomyces zhihengii]